MFFFFAFLAFGLYRMKESIDRWNKNLKMKWNKIKSTEHRNGKWKSKKGACIVYSNLKFFFWSMCLGSPSHSTLFFLFFCTLYFVLCTIIELRLSKHRIEVQSATLKLFFKIFWISKWMKLQYPEAMGVSLLFFSRLKLASELPVVSIYFLNKAHGLNK